MYTFKEFLSLQEAKDSYQINHPTYSSAISTALEFAKAKGFDMDPDEVFTQTGILNKKPKEGQTTRVSIPLTKNGKVQKKALQIQVYGKENGNFELNAYIL